MHAAASRGRPRVLSALEIRLWIPLAAANSRRVGIVAPAKPGTGLDECRRKEAVLGTREDRIERLDGAALAVASGTGTTPGSE